MFSLFLFLFVCEIYCVVFSLWVASYVFLWIPMDFNECLTQSSNPLCVPPNMGHGTSEAASMFDTKAAMHVGVIAFSATSKFWSVYLDAPI